MISQNELGTCLSWKSRVLSPLLQGATQGAKRLSSAAQYGADTAPAPAPARVTKTPPQTEMINTARLLESDTSYGVQSTLPPFR